MATINSENAKQIRDPMQVEISMQVGSNAKISNYAVPSTYKSYDNTLGNAEYSMRVLADLSGDGFPLDGTAKLYDPNETTSAGNGKLGYRANVGDDVTVTITATNSLTAVSIKASGISAIEYNGTSYPAASLNIIPMNTRTATLTFRVSSSIDRVAIDYIVPDITLQINNDNLVQCTLALRGNLSIIDHTWEESEIEIQAYYPYDISDSFKYVMNEWPILYRAGYDSDMSMVRRFYLSEPVTMTNNVITIKGVDASHRLDDKTMPEQWLDIQTNNAHQVIYQKFVSAIKSAGITVQRQQAWNGTAGGTWQHAILPEMTARDFVAGTMNLTLNHTNGSNKYGIQFVDAGIPTVEHGDGTNFGQIWTVRKSDCGEWQETRERNIAKFVETNEERNYNESISISKEVDELGGDTTALNIFSIDASKPGTLYKKDQLIDLSFDGFYANVRDFHNAVTAITVTPSGAVFKATKTSEWSTKKFTPWTDVHYVKNGKCIIGTPATITGGVKSFTNPNGLPGQKIEMEPFVYGTILDANGATVFNYPSLFNRSTHTISFTWKGDPRMQPLDYIRLYDDTKPTITPSTWYRITSIELNHEGGGTTANIEAREWIRPTSVPDYYVLGDDGGHHIVTDDNKDILVITEGE